MGSPLIDRHSYTLMDGLATVYCKNIHCKKSMLATILFLNIWKWSTSKGLLLAILLAPLLTTMEKAPIGTVPLPSVAAILNHCLGRSDLTPTCCLAEQGVLLLKGASQASSKSTRRAHARRNWCKLPGECPGSSWVKTLVQCLKTLMCGNILHPFTSSHQYLRHRRLSCPHIASSFRHAILNLAKKKAKA